MRGPVEARLIVRAPRATDAPAAAAVWFAGEERALTESYPDGYPREWFWMAEGSGAAEHLESQFRPAPRAAAWVAERDGRIVGMAAAGPNDAHEHVGVLHTLYVHPDDWGSGAGDALHEQAMAHLRAHFTSAELWVVQANMRARSFYERRGWRPTGEFNQPDRAPPLVRYAHDLA